MSKKTDILKLKKILIDRGFEPLFDFYLNSFQKLKVNCPVHGIFFTRSPLIIKGSGCRKCGRVSYGIKRRGSIEKVKQKAELIGLKLINDSFNSLKGEQLLTFECPTHGRFQKEKNSFMRGKGCQSCSHQSRAEKEKKSPEVFKKQVELIKPDYVLLSEYTKGKEKVLILCPKHGEFSIVANDLLGGHGCKKCGNKSLATQNEIANLVKNAGFEIEENTRQIIKPLELDIYIPSKNIAIEYCGIYWHGEDKKRKDYHENKLKLCEKKGIQLITIFSDEWMKKKEQVINILKAKMGVLPKLFARKCTVKEISKIESKAFINKYHLQGFTNSTLNLGIFSNENLVGVMTGNKHHRQGQDNCIVLSRLCFGEFAVIGGSSKLFKTFAEKAKKLGYKRIVSWSDNRWSEGKVYKELGFTLEKEMKTDYSYYKSNKRFSKQSCQKKNLIKKGAVGLTEKEMAISLGYIRIWDCGKKRWVINL